MAKGNMQQNAIGNSVPRMGYGGPAMGALAGRFAPQMSNTPNWQSMPDAGGRPGGMGIGRMAGGIPGMIDHAPMSGSIGRVNSPYQPGTQMPRVPMTNPSPIQGPGYGTGALGPQFDMNTLLKQLMGSNQIFNYGGGPR